MSTTHEQYADEVARMVLAVVQEVRRVASTPPALVDLEPTGIRVAPADVHFVSRRSR